MKWPSFFKNWIQSLRYIYHEKKREQWTNLKTRINVHTKQVNGEILACIWRTHTCMNMLPSSERDGEREKADGWWVGKWIEARWWWGESAKFTAELCFLILHAVQSVYHSCLGDGCIRFAKTHNLALISATEFPQKKTNVFKYINMNSMHLKPPEIFTLNDITGENNKHAIWT